MSYGRTDCDALRILTEKTLQGLLDGDRLDETVAQLIELRRHIDALRDTYNELVGGPDVEQVVDWIMKDETILCLIVNRLEGQ